MRLQAGEVYTNLLPKGNALKISGLALVERLKGQQAISSVRLSSGYFGPFADDVMLKISAIESVVFSVAENAGVIGDRFTAASKPTPASFGIGPIWVDGEQYWSDGVVFKPSTLQTSKDKTSLLETPPQIELDYSVMAASKSGTTSFIANVVAADDKDGLKITYPELTNPAQGDQATFLKDLTTPLDMSLLDNIKFEFAMGEENLLNANVYLIFASGASGLSSSSFYSLTGGVRLAENNFTLLKSDFNKLGTTVVDWANVTRIGVRISALANDTALKGDYKFKYISVGAKERPRVLLTLDDAAGDCYTAFQNVWLPRKMHGSIALTDYETPGTDNFDYYSASGNPQMTFAQLKDMTSNGWETVVHNTMHAPYGFYIASYSRAVNTVTMRIKGTPFYAGLTVFDRAGWQPKVGDGIDIDNCPAYVLNGRQVITSVTPVTASQDVDITFDVPAGTLAFTDRAISTGAQLMPDSSLYDLDWWVEKQKINLERLGLNFNPRAMCYTFGQNSKTARRVLNKKGIRIARATTGSGVHPVYNAMNGIQQLHSKTGIAGDSVNIMSINTTLLDTLTNVQAKVTRLKQTGGLLSFYTHGALDGGISQAQLDAMSTYLADERDAGNLDIINLSELEGLYYRRVV